MNNDWKPTEINEGQPVKSDYVVSSPPSLYIHNPEVICECDLFGQKQMVISFHRTDGFPIPNRWIRFWTRVFFNSKWDFKKDT